MKEIWKDIKDYPNYQVSNLGRVKSLKRVISYIDGRKRTYPEKILKLTKNKKNGYFYAYIGSVNRKTVSIHRLVAKIFMNNFDPNLDVDHIDENKANNNINNLQQLSHHDNTLKRNRHTSSINWCKRYKKWRVRVKYNCQEYNIGYYNCEKKAVKEYEKAFKKITGKTKKVKYIGEKAKKRL